ncbi:MAG TPA: protein-disulfide reductase DsbD family protein, partial [Verrucomicrobiota bacterium]|nr:protein-disulfide reductase DsbD family protein [Verrucomicrobiota bacterium]
MRLFVAIALILFSLDLRASESTANLLLNYKSITGNETVLGGIHIKLPSGWHTYWVNPGESGAPIKINFLFPKGFEPGEILYPTPVKHTVGGITSYVMEDETVLIFSIKTSSKLPNREYELKANVEWLECKEICRPASATVQNKIIVGTVSSLSTDAELLSKWQKRIPATNITLEIKAKWQKLNEDNKFQLILDVNSPYPISDFFPYLDKSVDIETSTIIEKSGTNEFRIKKNASLLEGVLPAQIGGVFTFSANLPDGRNACEIKNILVDSQTISVAGTKNKMSFWVAIYLAFFGGIILNFMPCVLPVISLKVLSFINNSTQSAGKIRLSGIAFAIGVIASLLILAGFVVLIQATGKFAGWGIQFQNP